MVVAVPLPLIPCLPVGSCSITQSSQLLLPFSFHSGCESVLDTAGFMLIYTFIFLN